MNIAIIDYESGNISSVINSFKSVSKKTNSDIKIEVTSDSVSYTHLTLPTKRIV